MTNAGPRFTLSSFKSLLFICWCAALVAVDAKKLILASSDECDRYALDALYHEKFNVTTEDIFQDYTEFALRITQLTVDSLLDIMSKLPGRDSSTVEERRLHASFAELTKKIMKDINKMRRNVTEIWNTLLHHNHELMLDTSNSSLEALRNSVSDLVGVYKKTRTALDSSLAYVLRPIKFIVRDGLKSIMTAARTELENAKKHTTAADAEDKSTKENEEENDEGDQKNDDEKDEVEDEDDGDEKDGEDTVIEVDEEELRSKVQNITSKSIPAFLGNVTLRLLEKRIDLEKEVNLKPEDRQSPLDDLNFDLQMMQARVNSVIQDDAPKTKEARDLARRSLYLYWSDLAAEMYNEKIEDQRLATPSVSREEKYRKIWADENDIVDSLITLMQVHS